MRNFDPPGNSDTKRKMYGSILVIGGGMMFKGTDNFLLRRLQAQLPVGYQFMRDQMEVITRPKVLLLYTLALFVVCLFTHCFTEVERYD